MREDQKLMRDAEEKALQKDREIQAKREKAEQERLYVQFWPIGVLNWLC